MGKRWGGRLEGLGCLPALAPATEFQERLETQHVRSIQHCRGDSYWQKMGTERKTGTTELFFSFEGRKKKKDLEEEKRREEPVHDSFTL